jgi:Type IV secretion system pilin
MATPEPLTGLESIFSNLVSVAIGLAGIAFFVMFVVGGFNYLTAGGDEGKVAGAKKTLTYAIAGLVLIALAYLIIKLIAQFTGVTGILNFQIYQP